MSANKKNSKKWWYVVISSQQSLPLDDIFVVYLSGALFFSFVQKNAIISANWVFSKLRSLSPWLPTILFSVTLFHMYNTHPHTIDRFPSIVFVRLTVLCSKQQPKKRETMLNYTHFSMRSCYQRKSQYVKLFAICCLHTHTHHTPANLAWTKSAQTLYTWERTFSGEKTMFFFSFRYIGLLLVVTVSENRIHRDGEKMKKVHLCTAAKQHNNFHIYAQNIYVIFVFA